MCVFLPTKGLGMETYLQGLVLNLSLTVAQGGQRATARAAVEVGMD